MMTINKLPKPSININKLNNIINGVNKQIYNNTYLNYNINNDVLDDCISVIQNYVENNIITYMNKDFNSKLYNKVYDAINTRFANYYKLKHNDFNRVEYDTELEECINYVLHYYFKNVFIPRSYIDNEFFDKIDHSIIEERLKVIEEKDAQNPQQRSDEWYVMRHSLLSASNIWMALSTPARRNSLILEKCEPINKNRGPIGLNSSLHWGQKYEPLAQMYYEQMYNATIKEYGCIKHSSIDFLGASPDGININPQSSRYGRMLEIKNVVSRELTGIPKVEYWVQTQLQMECCDLDYCDFLECDFTEYETEEDFINDGSFTLTENGKLKGIIAMFHNDNFPIYEYCPLNYNKEQFDKWEEEMFEKHSGKTWVKNIYWQLKNVSCVTIPRNKAWFNEVSNAFKELWDTVLKERVTGYEHRRPNKRNKTQNIVNSESIDNTNLVSELRNIDDSTSVYDNINNYNSSYYNSDNEDDYDNDLFENEDNTLLTTKTIINTDLVIDNSILENFVIKKTTETNENNDKSKSNRKPGLRQKIKNTLVIKIDT